MKKLTKQQIDARNEIQADIIAAAEAFESARNTLNEHIEKANEWAQDVMSSIDDYMSERSEKWLEGERGQAYESWKSSYEDFSIETIDEPDLPGEEAFADVEEEPSL